MTTDEREDENESKGDGETAESSAASDGSPASDARSTDGEDARYANDDDAPPAAALSTRAFGTERYLQAAFAVLALAVFWVAQQSIVGLWNLFTEPNVVVATAVAAVIAIGGVFALYRHERFGQLAREIATELSKVTWPSREETQVSTIVVIVTSVVAALYLGVFDALWSAVTDLLYSA